MPLRAWLLPPLLFAAACARELPAPPAAGEPCESDADCDAEPDAADGSCGFLRLCVQGRCEVATDAAVGSRLVVCERDDAGRD